MIAADQIISQISGQYYFFKECCKNKINVLKGSKNVISFQTCTDFKIGPSIDYELGCYQFIEKTKIPMYIAAKVAITSDKSAIAARGLFAALIQSIPNLIMNIM